MLVKIKEKIDCRFNGIAKDEAKKIQGKTVRASMRRSRTKTWWEYITNNPACPKLVLTEAELG